MTSVRTRLSYQKKQIDRAAHEAAAATEAVAAISPATLGSVTLDFGAFPGSNEALASFADVGVAAVSVIHAWFRADDTTAEHTASDHRYAPVFIQLTALPTAGVGGTIYARSVHKMQGQWKVRYSWE